MAVAVLLLELDEGLTIGCTLHCEAALLPHAYDVILLCLEVLQKSGGAQAKGLTATMHAVGVEHGNHGIDEDEVQGVWTHPLIARHGGCIE